MNREQQRNDIIQKKIALEKKYMLNHNFKTYKNYALPEDLVQKSKNVLAFGAHRDVGFEQEICNQNPFLNIHEFDPTPDSVELFKTDFPFKNNITFHPVAYAKEKGTMKFYYNPEKPGTCYSLLPICDKTAYIEVETNSLKNIVDEIMPNVDIIKADVEGVWYDMCREILDYNIDFKAFLIEFELGTGDYDEEIQWLADMEKILVEFKEAGYTIYLNRSRDHKPISEAIIIK